MANSRYETNEKKAASDSSEAMTGKEKLRTFLGCPLFAPFDAFYGLCKGTYYYLKAKVKGQNYLYEAHSLNIHNVKGQDRLGKTMSFTFGLSRIATVAMTAVCVLGFIGALASPFPGTTPAYVGALFLGAKGLGLVAPIGIAVGITTAWAFFGRVVGSCIGAVCDYFKLKKSLEAGAKTLEKDNEANKIAIRAAIGTSLFGEAYYSARKLLKSFAKRVGLGLDTEKSMANNDGQTQKRESTARVMSMRPSGRSSNSQKKSSNSHGSSDVGIKNSDRIGMNSSRPPLVLDVVVGSPPEPGSDLDSDSDDDNIDRRPTRRNS